MADEMVKFVSTTELNARREEKRKARQQILYKAKADYEREERRRAKRKETGQDTWMLPSLEDRIPDENSKKKKRRKEKKEKKSKKNKKKLKKEKEKSSESNSSDEWVVKGAENQEDEKNESVEKKASSTQRESWMLFPCFSASTKPLIQPKNEDDEAMKEEEEKRLSNLDLAGQHPRELNPYWKDGGVGLPNALKQDAKIVYDVKWLKKSLQRSIELAGEEGRSLEDVVADRWGSLEQLKTMIAEAERRPSEKLQESKVKRDRDQREERSWSRQTHSKRNKMSDAARGRREKHREKLSDYEKNQYPDKGHDNVNDRCKDKNISQRQERDTARNRGYDRSDHRDRRDLNRDSENRSSERRDDNDSCHSMYSQDYMSRRTENSGFRRPGTTGTSALLSLNFMKPVEESSDTSYDLDYAKWKERGAKCGQSSGGWRKNVPKTNRIEEALKKRKDNSKEENEQSSHSDSSESEVDEKNIETNTDNKDHFSKGKETVTGEHVLPCVEPAIPVKEITETSLNNMGAKILRAELMGNEDLASQLKATLEQMRKDKEAQESSSSSGKEAEKEIVVLTRTDKFGNTRPVTMSGGPESQANRRKKEKVETHDRSGHRERYFADDDRHDLKEIVRREKMNTAEDYNSLFSRLASKGATKTDSEEFTLDDHFVSVASAKLSKAREEERERTRAIREHQRLSEQLSKCRFCFENPDLAKHLIISIGIQVYLALPLHTSLTEGHCLIIPMQHQVASTYLDEDVVDEFKGKDVIFLETCHSLARQSHMIVECIPLPKEEGALAPMYFKKAILESELEWAQNKKLVDTREKGLRGSIPKGLPYFAVEFGLDGGYAHVIEDEHAFPRYFGKEVIGGMLDLEPRAWRNARKENFEQHKSKVLQFADWWKPYDWTKRLKRD